MHLHVLQEYIPVGRNGSVSARMHGIAERVQDRLSGGWHLLRAQCLLAEQLEDRLRSDGGQEFAFQIRPYVSITGLQQYWSWRDQRNQHVRVHRKTIHLIA